MLTEWLQGILPESIRNRRWNGSFNEYCFRALAGSLPRIDSLVRHAPVEHLRLLDKNVLVNCLEQAALGIGRDGRALDRLHLTLSFLIWLSHQDQWQRESEPNSKIIPI